MRFLLLACSLLAVASSAPSNVEVENAQDLQPIHSGLPINLRDAPNGEKVEPRLMDSPYVFNPILKIIQS
jgi:hypothetical protein